MKGKKLSAARRAYVGLMKGLMWLSAGLTAALTAFLIVYVLAKGVPNITWKLLSTAPSYLTGDIGILPETIITAMASPMARPTPSTTAAAMPLLAAGTDTLK